MNLYLIAIFIANIYLQIQIINHLQYIIPYGEKIIVNELLALV